MWNSIIANVTSGYCINTTNGNSFYMALDNSIIYNCASGGVYVSASNAAYNGNLEMYNTIVYGNGTYGINFSGGSCGIPQIFHNNAFGSNTTAATSGLCANDSTPAGTITLTANPFVSASTGNFALNSTSGGGALLRAAGWVSAFPGISTSNYLSVGPAQLAAGGGSTASNYGWAK